MSEMMKITFLEPNGGCGRKDRSAEDFAAAKDDLELYAMYDPDDRGEMPYYANREAEEEKSKIEVKFEAVVEGIEEAMEDLKDKMEDTMDVAKEKFADAKEKLTDVAEKAVDKFDSVINDPDNRQAFEDGVAKVKAAVAKPVDVSIKRDGSVQVPAGVLGAVAAAALYPLHKSKVVGAAALGTLGYWAVNKLGGIEGSKEFVKETAQNLKGTFAKDAEGAAEAESIVLKP